jgi:glycosyltransferase involved in cell wall biosynthesis
MNEVIEAYSMPYDVHGSPYFKSWRAALARVPEPIRLSPLPEGGLWALLLQRPWRSSRRILCVHWSTELDGSRYLSLSVLRLASNVLAVLILKAFFGFKVTWVLHNNHAHDYPHPRMDRFGRSVTAALAEGIVAQQAASAEKMRARYPRKRVAYVPLSNDIGEYGPLIRDKRAMRARFGFAERDIVCLVLGSVRPYKRIEKILEAFQALTDAERSHLALWIAGMGNPKQYFDGLREMAEGDPRIHFENTFIPDADIAAYAACADYSVAYFDDSELTSASIMLSLSYGLPVIVRDIAGAERVKDGVNGYTFQDTEGLTRIFAGLKDTAVPSQDMVIASVAADTWDAAAEKYLALWSALV